MSQEQDHLWEMEYPWCLALFGLTRYWSHKGPIEWQSTYREDQQAKLEDQANAKVSRASTWAQSHPGGIRQSMSVSMKEEKSHIRFISCRGFNS